MGQGIGIVLLCRWRVDDDGALIMGMVTLVLWCGGRADGRMYVQNRIGVLEGNERKLRQMCPSAELLAIALRREL